MIVNTGKWEPKSLGTNTVMMPNPWDVSSKKINLNEELKASTYTYK